MQLEMVHPSSPPYHLLATANSNTATAASAHKAQDCHNLQILKSLDPSGRVVNHLI